MSPRSEADVTTRARSDDTRPPSTETVVRHASTAGDLEDFDALWFRSQIMHARRFPVRYRFVYRLFTGLWNIDRLDALDARLRWFGHNRFHLFSLRQADHGPRDGSAWRPWLVRTLRRHGIEAEPGPVFLLASPRILGLAFNPLSLWYCHDIHGQPIAVILEVRNTFGENHHYVLRSDGRWPLRAEKPKNFHVSPFVSMDQHYRFRLGAPGATLSVFIHEYNEDGLMLAASQTGAGSTVTDRALLGSLVRSPFGAIKVVVLIHWQALRIWWKGARFHSKPHAPKEGSS